jgi:hypothetical protein
MHCGGCFVCGEPLLSQHRRLKEIGVNIVGNGADHFESRAATQPRSTSPLLQIHSIRLFGPQIFLEVRVGVSCRCWSMAIRTRIGMHWRHCGHWPMTWKESTVHSLAAVVVTTATMMATYSTTRCFHYNYPSDFASAWY